MSDCPLGSRPVDEGGALYECGNGSRPGMNEVYMMFAKRGALPR